MPVDNDTLVMIIEQFLIEVEAVEPDDASEESDEEDQEEERREEPAADKSAKGANLPASAIAEAGAPGAKTGAN